MYKRQGLSAIISVVLAAVTFLLARPLLILIRTPENILDMAVVYIQVIFIGIPAAVLYNYSACALRAVGDSRHPFYFLVFSSVLNIVPVSYTHLDVYKRQIAVQ